MSEVEEITAEWSVGPYVVRASWSGGAYIDLMMPECVVATECINVWDYGQGKIQIDFTKEALQEALDEWCEETFGESNPDGGHNLRAYIFNGSF